MSFARISPARFHALAPLALAAVALVGCDIVEGAEGHMRFDDTTLGAVGLDDNLAVGATSFVVVHCDDCTGTRIGSATSSDSSVLQVVSTGEGSDTTTGDTVEIRGVAPGSAFLEVTISGVTDRVEVQVADAVDATVRFEPWESLATLPPTLWADGFALFPEGEIDVRAFPKDAAGDRTTGFGAVTWQADGGAVVTMSEARRSDTVTVTAPAEGTFSLTPSVGPALAASVVTDADITDLAVYSATDEVLRDGDTLTIESDDSAILHLAAYTESGAYVHGDAGVRPTWALTDGAEGLLDDTFADLAEGAEEEDIDAVYAAYPRGYLLSATGGVGTGSLELTWNGHTVTLVLEVVPPTDANE